MTSNQVYLQELQAGLQAVHLASLLTKQHLLTYQSTKAKVSEETKSDASEVTVADFAAQAVIISAVHNAFPDDSFIAEESSDMLRSNVDLAERVWNLVTQAKVILKDTQPLWGDHEGHVQVVLPATREEMIDVIDLGQQGGTAQATSERTWILDPIDGTKTYIRAQQYAVCLCLVDQGEQQVAILGCSNLNIDSRDEQGRVIVREDVVDLAPRGGWILSAIKGQGTYVERISEPGARKPIKDVVGLGSNAKTSNGYSSSGDRSIEIRFTDSSASPHISKPLHNQVFEHFLPHVPPHERKLSTPAVPEGTPSLAVDLWSMQLKYVILALRGAGADAMIRTPPQLDYHAACWDHAGGQLLLTESGGVLTDATGKLFVVDGKDRKLIQNWGVCATRGGNYDGEGIGPNEAHGAVLAKVRELVEARDSGKGP